MARTTDSTRFRGTLPTLPEGILGFMARRADKGDRLALYRPDGVLSNSFALDATLDSITAATGLRFLTLPCGTVGAYLGAAR